MTQRLDLYRGARAPELWMETAHEASGATAPGILRTDGDLLANAIWRSLPVATVARLYSRLGALLQSVDAHPMTSHLPGASLPVVGRDVRGGGA